MEKEFFSNSDYSLPEANLELCKKVTQNSDVLDLGCSIGQNSQILKRTKNCRIMGVDFATDYLNRAKQVCDEVIQCDLNNSMSLMEKINEAKMHRFDHILLADVIEHLAYPEELLMRLKTLLKPGGSFIISIPNVANWQVRLHLLSGQFNYTGGVLDPGHLRFFTLRSFLALLNHIGCEAVSIEPRNATWPLKLLSKLRKTLFAFQFVIVARSKFEEAQ